MKPASYLALLLATAAFAVAQTDVEGKAHRPLADEGQVATVLIFVLHDCPIANSYAPEISRIAEEYGKRRVRTYVVYGEDDLSPADAKKHAHDYAYRCPALLDPQRALVRKAGATVSPEAVVFSPKGDVLYWGRIDDRALAPGKHVAEPRQRDLREALDAIVAGKPVRERFTKAIGCYLPEASPKNRP